MLTTDTIIAVAESWRARGAGEPVVRTEGVSIGTDGSGGGF